MKKKRIFSALVAAALPLLLLGGCKSQTGNTTQVETGPVPTENGSGSHWKDFDIQIYPVDLAFTDCAELILSGDMQSADSAEQTELTLQANTSAMCETNPAQIQFEASDGMGSTPAGEYDADVSSILAFRKEATDMKTGATIYHIQVQLEDNEAITILTGTLWPGEKVEWEEAEFSTGVQALQKARLKAALLSDVQWIACTEAEIFAHNKMLTSCVVFDQSAIYTNEEHTVFQIQRYDDHGRLERVAALSQSAAQTLLDGKVGPVLWSEDIYPVMHLTIQDTSGQKNAESGNWMETDIGQSESLGQMPGKDGCIVMLLKITSGVLAVSNLICLICLFRRKKTKARKKHNNAAAEQDKWENGRIKDIAAVQNIGGRCTQQDSCGVVQCPAGTLAVVADGMGGLSDGDKVSQKIVATMRSDAARIRPGQTDNVLCQMVAHANQEINRMLGSARQYKSGSTVLAVLIEKNTMQWITVGDSRIYLCRGGSLIQLNREHVYYVELLKQAINGKLSFAEAAHDPQAERLSSFIGMGDLKHVDFCLNKLHLREGDRILLMSDGVFNTLSEEEIAKAVQAAGDTAQAVASLEQEVLQKNVPNQDNFTCVLLEVS